MYDDHDYCDLKMCRCHLRTCWCYEYRTPEQGGDDLDELCPGGSEHGLVGEGTPVWREVQPAGG